MKAKFESSFPKISASELDEFEKKISAELEKKTKIKRTIRFPDSYRQFLLEVNGGSPVPYLNYFKGSYSYMHMIDSFFYGYHPTPPNRDNLLFEWYSFIDFSDSFNDEIAMPISSQSDGSYLAIVLTGIERGVIYEFDHGNAEKIAKDFDEFINGVDYGEKPYGFEAMVKQYVHTSQGEQLLLSYLDSKEFSEEDLGEMLDYALDLGCLPAIKKLIESGAPVPDRWLLGFFKSVPIAAYMLELGLPLNGVGKSGFTPLARAVQSGNLEVIIFLIQQGADYNYVDEERGFSILDEAEDMLHYYEEGWPINFSEIKAKLRQTIAYLESLGVSRNRKA